MSEAISDSKLTQLAKWLTDAAVNGIGPLSSSIQLADEYKLDTDYPDKDSRVSSLINWETSKNFGTGFLTGLGGFVTLPITIPAGHGGGMGGASTHDWCNRGNLRSFGQGRSS